MTEDRHVLIVEPERDMAGVLKTVFEDKGYQTSVTRQSSDALIAIQEEGRPDIMILDDLEFAVKANESFPQVPIILFSISAYDPSAIESKKNGIIHEAIDKLEPLNSLVTKAENLLSNKTA